MGKYRNSNTRNGNQISIHQKSNIEPRIPSNTILQAPINTRCLNKRARQLRRAPKISDPVAWDIPNVLKGNFIVHVLVKRPAATLATLTAALAARTTTIAAIIIAATVTT